MSAALPVRSAASVLNADSEPGAPGRLVHVRSAALITTCPGVTLASSVPVNVIVVVLPSGYVSQTPVMVPPVNVSDVGAAPAATVGPLVTVIPGGTASVRTTSNASVLLAAACDTTMLNV